MVSKAQRPDSLNGHVEIRPLVPPSEGAVPLAQAFRRFPSQEHVWTPASGLCDALPRGFKISMTAWIGGDGLRRFTPTGGLDVFLPVASIAGLAVLGLQDKTTPEVRSAYHTMRYAFQLRRSFQEDLNRSFKSSNDLHLPRRSSTRSAGCHVLPVDVGQAPNGTGDGWSPNRLIQEGRQACGERGSAEADWIRAGLLLAAQRNPLPAEGLSEVQAAALVRMALFDFDPTDRPVGEVKMSAVDGRFVDAIEKHSRVPFPAFKKWLFEDLPNIVHAISKRKQGGVKLTRKDVRSGLLDLTFRSFRYVGDCVHVFTRAFAAALPEPLSGREKQWFDALFARRPWWGGLPLVLLRDRLDYLGRACADLYEKPDDPTAIGVVLRLLDWYGQMARDRRRADTDRKKRGRTKVVTYNENDPAAVSPAPKGQHFERIATAAIRMTGTACKCPEMPDWDVHAVGPTDPPADPVPLEYHCETCGVSGTVAVLQSTFKEAKG